MSDIEDDNKTFGTLFGGVIAVLVLLWLGRIVLGVFFSLAESVFKLGFYALVTYMVLGLLFYVYAKLLPNQTPKFLREMLRLHHYLAGRGGKIVSFCISLFRRCRR